MKRKFSTRIITCIATSAVLAVGTLSFTVISAIADEAVSYYGLSADGTVISGTVTDYTKIASTDTAWGTAGKETWYVADGIVNIITTTYDYDNNKNVYNPVEIKGNVNVILKNGAVVSVVNGIAGTDATITFIVRVKTQAVLLALSERTAIMADGVRRIAVPIRLTEKTVRTAKLR